MTLWKLEWLRLVRTQRWLILLAVYGVFGLLGPLTVAYLPDLLESLGEDAVAGLPEFTPPDAMTQYLGNVQQIGILVVAFIAAAALSFDNNTEMAIFLRTRATVRDIVIPRFAVSSAAAVAAFAVGTTIAYVATGALLEWLDLGPILVGAALHALYLVFVVAAVSVVASFIRSVPGVAVVTTVGLIALGVLTLVTPIAPWLPSDLLGALDVLLRGGEFDYWRSVAVTVALTAVFVPWSIARLGTREL